MPPPVNRDHWQQLKAAFNGAMVLSGDERSAYLQQIGATDEWLRSEVESLLAANEAADPDFLSAPALSPLPAAPGEGRLTLQ